MVKVGSTVWGNGCVVMSTPSEILKLIERFDRNAEAYHAAGYNEAQVRQEFINPFFKCLGWDMDNEQGYAEAYKDVIHEDAIKVGGATKAPDYCFRIGGTTHLWYTHEGVGPEVAARSRFGTVCRSKEDDL